MYHWHVAQERKTTGARAFALRWGRWRAYLLLLWLLPYATTAHGQVIGATADSSASPDSFPLTQCGKTTIQADAMHCSQQNCQLTGNVRMTCGDTFIQAEQATVRMDAWGQLEFAQVSEKVLLWSEQQVLTCELLLLEPGKQRLELHNGHMTFHLPSSQQAQVSRAYGTVRAQLAASLIYRDNQMLHACGSQFSSCHCPAGQDVPWLVSSPHIVIQPGVRAISWWPMLYVRLPLGPLFPITPPLLPLSLPLQARVMGLLPPIFQFYTTSWLPSVRLPIFFPLGPSWDITISPGLRTDWAQSKLSKPGKQWLLAAGAPQLYSKIRYAPWQEVQGVLRLRYTYDGSLASIWGQRATRDDIARLWEQQQGQLLPAIEQALKHRLFLQWQHQSHWPTGLDTLLHLQYFSDSRIPEDFAFSAMTRLATYQPSRAQFYAYSFYGTALLKAETYTRIDSDLALLEQPEQLITTYGIQPGVLQRLPTLALQLLPWQLGGNWSVQANAEWNVVRPLLRRPSTLPAQVLLSGNLPQSTFWLLQGRTSLAWQRPLGIFANGLTFAYDALVTYNRANKQLTLEHGWLQEGAVRMPLLGQWAGWRHTIEPGWHWRLFWNQPISGRRPQADALLGVVDPWLLRQSTQQTALIIRQRLVAPDPKRFELTLELGQPARLGSLQWLQHWGEGRLKSGWFEVGLFWAVQWPQVSQAMAMPELSGELAWRWQGWQLWGRYVRIEENVDRFRRSPYSITALQALPTASDQPLRQHHTTLSTHVPLPANWYLEVTTGLSLRKQWSNSQQPWWSCAESGEPEKFCWNMHMVQLRYQSPCNCFALTGQAFIDPNKLSSSDTLSQAIRLNISLAIQPQ